ncbi:MAG: restriction endonuclease subunit S [Dokdonella sp.]
MRKPLRAIADIGVGHSFRLGIEDDPAGDIRVLQIRDIKGAGIIQEDALLRMTWPASGEPPLLKPGDVVLPSRGGRYDAVLIQGKEPMLASGQLYVLHASQRSLLPEYLCWYLNQPASRSYMLRNRAGTGIPSLSRQVLGDLPVPVPSMETQRKIVALQQLWQHEQDLTQKLLANRQKMLDSLFGKLVLK